jgi:hypothetical protein
MDETEIFIAGWQSGMQRAIESIKEESANWLLNGPSKLTAERIIDMLTAIPTPRAENEIRDETV